MQDPSEGCTEQQEAALKLPRHEFQAFFDLSILYAGEGLPPSHFMSSTSW